MIYREIIEWMFAISIGAISFFLVDYLEAWDSKYIIGVPVMTLFLSKLGMVFYRIYHLRSKNSNDD